MTEPEIHLHLGAHKTASSHLQKSLRQNPDVLAGLGVRFLPPQHYRRTLAPLQLALRDGEDRQQLVARAGMMLRGAADGAPRLIVSDENILGNLPRVARDGRLYPWAQGRLHRSITVMGAPPACVYLAVRNIADYLVSAHSESLIHKPFRSFDAFLATMAPASLSWAQLVADLRPALGRSELILWRQEDYPRVQERIVSRMIGAPCPDAFKFLALRPRPGLSARALRALEKWSAEGRDIRQDGLIAHARELFPKSDAFPAPEPFSAKERAILDRNYRHDWQALKAMPHVTVIESETEPQ
ncbi:hypothetical protein [Brevirhabdus sp.]|uniref:hypothetical protein n=1 Tax=Brevirhabdus sp. TaxID=2004514 RepID=UPI0040584280